MKSNFSYISKFQYEIENILLKSVSYHIDKSWLSPGHPTTHDRLLNYEKIFSIQLAIIYYETVSL